MRAGRADAAEPAKAMDHTTIDAENVAERYVTGRLSAAEAGRFEEHFLTCPECCARVESAERLLRGLRTVAEEDGAGAPGRREGFRLPPWARLAAAAVLALALLPALILQREAGRLRSELAATRAALARRPAGRPEGDLAAELQRARGELATESARRAAGEREAAAARRPLVDLPVLALTPLRGGAEGPVRTLTLPKEPGWIALWVEPGGDEYPAYRAVLRPASGAAVFTASGLPANDLGALLFAVHSSSLAAGSYRLEVDGLPPGGPPVPVARFPLRVVAPR